ncbi:MAG: hypothetical protein JWN04_3247, partial [Myxococcaceae bacterium]|nr:hypothetical protein [Myxococcaceae bacterium]
MTKSDKSTDNREHTADTRNPDWESYSPEGHGRTDEQIRADVHAALSGGAGAPDQTLSVSVEDGIVSLSGSVSSADERKKVLERVRSVP